MANHNCVEPAQQTAADHTIVLAPAGDMITFPSIDSCFGICLVLSDGALLGGHVPVFFDDTAVGVEMSKMGYVGRTSGAVYDAQGGGMAVSLGKIIELMNAQRGDRTATLTVTLGDPDWYDLWDGQRGKFGFTKQIRYKKTTGARNLIVNSGNNTIRVQRRIGGAYLNQVTAERQFAQGTINGVPIAI